VLILSRRAGEAMMIGDDVTIVILGIKGRQVRVGISAPKRINIFRQEILPRLEPGEDRSALLDNLPAPRATSQVSGQPHRQLRTEGVGLSSLETPD
jgi:carbon storage regulator